MRWMKFWKEPTNLEKLIEVVETRMLASEVDSEEYVKQMDKLKQLYVIRQNTRRTRISADTIAICVTNLLGIVVIVGYENRHVITSKGLGEIIRPKLPGRQQL